MPLVFKTPKDSNQPVDIVGVGVLPAGGVGGVPVAVAAQRGFTPLVQVDPATGYPRTNEDGSYVVLEGSALAAAAKEWADAQGGAVEAVNLRNEDIAKLATEAGQPLDEYPDARTKAEQEYVRQQPPAEVAAAVAVQEDAVPTGPATTTDGGEG